MDENNLGYGATKAFLDKFAGKAAEKPAETFGAAWDYAFGWVNFASAKKQAIRQKDLEKFLLTIGDNISEIPDENIQEPKLSLIGPALESTKYYIDEKDLRELFINLISRSMDNRYNKEVNHAFVEVIKQLSPIDAYLFKKMNKSTIPVARYLLKFEDLSSIYLNNYFIIDDMFDSDQTAISLSNLQRVGLINIPPGKPLKKKTFYDPYYNTQEYFDIKSNDSIIKSKEAIDRLLDEFGGDEEKVIQTLGMTREIFDSTKQFREVDVDKTHASVTSFGTAFYNVCIE
ncbi:DUF4393 domain-containing protein [Salinicoccus halitifaciens]|uniref:DUF4393 domain-containing protein n=1 Tax=Salinicoccus halitifaciens TaxID=1073415 RepID=A0ABV2E8X1_9STAP|nr:DUF4393 domain-containing protein [Salinicoccus halitifaciens]MCD2136426.1 DUF4393 domain-containing protein [Salinicoccus halitifaciens]